MQNLFYSIWVDGIIGFRKHNPERTDWKFTLFVIVTTCNALNLFTIDAILNIAGLKTFLIKVDFLKIPIINSFTGFIL